MASSGQRGDRQRGRRWPGRVPARSGHAPAPTGARRKATGGGSGGLGRPDGAGPGKWRQVSGPGGFLSLSIYFCSVLFYLISFCHCFEF